MWIAQFLLMAIDQSNQPNHEGGETMSTEDDVEAEHLNIIFFQCSAKISLLTYFAEDDESVALKIKIIRFSA